MKASKILRFVNLLLAGTLTGNEVGTLAGVHPALGELSPAEQIRAEQEVTRWLGAIMPFWMGLTIASSVLVALSSRGEGGFRRTLLGAACLVALLASTLIGNVPINGRIIEMEPEKDQEEFAELRRRWDRLHTLRVALDVAGLAFLVSGALAENRR
jgi:hypothetical protein